MDYRIIRHKSADKYYKNQPPAIKNIIDRAEKKILDNPRRNCMPGTISRLRGENIPLHYYRGLPGNRRIIYLIDDEQSLIRIIYIGPHPKPGEYHRIVKRRL